MEVKEYGLLHLVVAWVCKRPRSDLHETDPECVRLVTAMGHACKNSVNQDWGVIYLKEVLIAQSNADKSYTRSILLEEGCRVF
jgi:hypothetical protein